MKEQTAAKVVVIQDGGRLHYALPVALERAGMLERVFTDYYVKRGSAAGVAAGVVGRFRPQVARRMLARRNDGLPDGKVFCNLALTVMQSRRRNRYPTIEAYFEAQAQALGEWVGRVGFGGGTAMMGFIRSIHPRLCAAAKERGLKVVGDQMIAPMAVERAEAERQRERFPGWETEEASEGWRIMERLERETWALADHITCASEYVRAGLLAEGIGAERISVLPYPIDAGHFAVAQRAGRGGPVTVGCVGAVGLRKGAPYFFEVARKLAGPGMRFVMVGGTSLKPGVLAEKRGVVEMIGSVPRPEVAGWLERFDILLFPSTCEGSAGSVMEAMASGLPVVTSANSGSVARDGVEGYVRAYDDVEGMAACVEGLARDAERRREMGRAARLRAEEFTIDAYGRGLRGVF